MRDHSRSKLTVTLWRAVNPTCSKQRHIPNFLARYRPKPTGPIPTRYRRGSIMSLPRRERRRPIPWSPTRTTLYQTIMPDVKRWLPDEEAAQSRAEFGAEMARLKPAFLGPQDAVMKLQDLAQVVRSKNAGPRRFTLDIIFRDDADYQRAAQSEAITAEKSRRFTAWRQTPLASSTTRWAAPSRSWCRAKSCRAIPVTAMCMAPSSTRRFWTSNYERLRPHPRSVFQSEPVGADPNPGASGQLGYGIPTPAFSAGLEREPHLIGCDMGSIDIGPYYLGSGEMATAPASTKRDLKKVLLGRARAQHPAGDRIGRIGRRQAASRCDAGAGARHCPRRRIALSHGGAACRYR